MYVSELELKWKGSCQQEFTLIRLSLVALKASLSVLASTAPPPGRLSFMDIKVGFVGSAWERKDHPFISLWAGATMWDHLMHSEKGVPRQSLLTHPWNASSWTFSGALSCSRPLLAFLTSWGQSRLPIRAEQLWNKTAPRRPCWLQEWICLTDELSCQRWACHAWLKMISVTPVHRPWPLSDLFSNGNGFMWTLSGVGPWFPVRPGQAFERRLSELEEQPADESKQG